MTGVHKSNSSQREAHRGRHRFEHWYRDHQVYFITARCRDQLPALAGEQAKAIFWDRFSHYTAATNFKPFIVSLLDNHYHVLGYLPRGSDLRVMMKGLHGSVAKLVNDLRPERLTPFWRDRRLHNYFDGCIRDARQFDRCYRYVLRQSVRHGLAAEWRDYAHTRVFYSCAEALRFSMERDGFMPRVPYKRYEKTQGD